MRGFSKAKTVLFLLNSYAFIATLRSFFENSHLFTSSKLMDSST